MPRTVVLAVGLDASLLASQSVTFRTAGYFFTPVGSVRDAIDHLQGGDFDLVLLGDSISTASKERLTFLIRAYVPLIPVVCVTDSSGDCYSYADATITNDSAELLRRIEELLAQKGRDSSEVAAQRRGSHGGSKHAGNGSCRE
jgi:hypothetical protein